MTKKEIMDEIVRLTQPGWQENEEVVRTVQTLSKKLSKKTQTTILEPKQLLFIIKGKCWLVGMREK